MSTETMRNALRPDTGIYYYVRSLMPYHGQIIVLGAFASEKIAYEKGVKSVPIPFEVVKLNTRDMDKAKDICKAMFLEQTGNLDTALNRTKHTMPSKSEVR